ncbi:MAG: NUDIX hydrolase [Actinomycetota bacterium]|nr:NUDIX hydrolase [Actinomycetota bacterium]
MKTEHQTSAGGVLVRGGEAGPEILLASRRTRRGELVWGLPKGLVEEGESPADAALREVREETGHSGAIRESLGEVSYWFVWDVTRVRKTVHFFLMDDTGEPPGERDHEMEEVRWFPLADAAKRAGFKSEKEILRKASQMIEP